MTRTLLKLLFVIDKAERKRLKAEMQRLFDLGTVQRVWL